MRCNDLQSRVRRRRRRHVPYSGFEQVHEILAGDTQLVQKSRGMRACIHCRNTRRVGDVVPRYCRYDESCDVVANLLHLALHSCDISACLH